MQVKLPDYNEIPDVGLYLDQVTKYINGYLLLNGCNEVTPSMISNYVKLKIVPKAHKKTYSREQIAMFIFVSFSKAVLSMDQIRDSFKIQSELCSIEEAYHLFYEDMMKEDYDMPTEIKNEKDIIHFVSSGVKHKIILDSYFKDRNS
ncbi:MAG: DUF1836 domain-containing protein [Erysipelotrichaceae bacterium]|nr:DUF1836 domain-containing protein [Erysipelotrichaceae bacterium]